MWPTVTVEAVANIRASGMLFEMLEMGDSRGMDTSLVRSEPPMTFRAPFNTSGIKE